MTKQKNRTRRSKLNKTRKRQRGGNPVIVSEYMELLTTYAVNDAIHDFKPLSNSDISSLLIGVPNSSYSRYRNEDELLESIKITKINDDSIKLPFSIKELYNINKNMMKNLLLIYYLKIILNVLIIFE